MTLYAITPLSVPSLLYLCHVGKLTSFQELIKTFTLKFFRDAKGSFKNASLSGGNLFFADAKGSFKNASQKIPEMVGGLVCNRVAGLWEYLCTGKRI